MSNEAAAAFPQNETAAKKSNANKKKHSHLVNLI
jgi:hypothetical protein